MKIRLFTLGRADISISIGALAVVAAAVLMGRAGDMALCMAALSLHEGAHTLAAMAAGRRVGEIELTPVGFCARLSGKRPNVFDELFIASAGPLFSLFGGLGCYCVNKSGLIAADIVERFAYINIAIAAVNMIPAVPLDGGRMLECALRHRLRGKSVRLICMLTGILCSAAVTAAGVYAAVYASAPPMGAVFGLFMAVSAIRHSRGQDVYTARRLAGARERIGAGLGAGIAGVAMDKNVSARQALRFARGSGLTVYAVLDSRMRTIGYVNEAEIYEAMARKGADITLGQVIIYK